MLATKDSKYLDSNKKNKNHLSELSIKTLRQSIINNKVFVDLINRFDFIYSQKNLFCKDKDQILQKWLLETQKINEETIKKFVQAYNKTHKSVLEMDWLHKFFSDVDKRRF